MAWSQLKKLSTIPPLLLSFFCFIIKTFSPLWPFPLLTLFWRILCHSKSDRCFFTMPQIMSALKCAPPFNSFFHIRLHRSLLSFISFLWIFRSLSVLSSHISSLFFYFHFFISLSKQITGYLYSFSVCFPRGFASFFPFSFPNLLFFHMLSPAFPFSTIRGGNLIVIIWQWNFF